jgi:site-specific DNA-methyltransferase (adenine-specific)
MINPALFSSASGEWSTPQELFDELDREFDFELDPAASEYNFKCWNHYTLYHDSGQGWLVRLPEMGGLEQSWAPRRTFVNPPYGRGVGAWVKKAAEENEAGALVVMLLPARTDTAWFHDHIYENANVEIRFLRGRLKFGGATNSAPFPSMVVIFKRPQDLTDFEKLERSIRRVDNGKKKKTRYPLR